MAKARRQKNEEQKPESSGGVVLHQKLCLSIDMENRRIYGYTELKILLQEGERIALHADNINIRSVSVDGEQCEFEYCPHYQDIDEEKRWSSVSCSKSAADLAGSNYISSLSKETIPNLIISHNQSMKSENEQHIQENGGNIVQSSSEEQIVNDYNGLLEDKNVKLVRIDYLLDRADTGIHFAGDMLHTNNQIRRARCWFPCMDNVAQHCLFDLEFTVSTNLVAVSNGNLLYQVLSKDNPPRKTFVYKLNAPVSAGWISLVVGPFKVLPDCQNNLLSHMCLSPNYSKLQNTIGFFHSAFSFYEDYLSISYPFGSYKQVFIPSDLTVSSMSLGASMCIFSSDFLYDEKIIDQTINTRIKLAYALAMQWFGVYITAEEENDEWLLNGLAGFLTDNFIKHSLGNNEARYRRYKANCAVCKADVSGATALSSSGASSDLYGTQTIGLYGKIRSWKAVAVFQMLEKQMGPDSFRKILQMIVSKGPGQNRSSRTLSTKEFRHLANKVGNLERPFLKEFFPRWVESCGCPIMRMGISYNKRRNMVELAVMRDITVKGGSGSNPDNEIREGGAGWPGMMSIRVHELDGMYDHPILPMAGESWQLLEVQCHCKLAAKRIQKPKKGVKHDGSDDNADAVATQDTRTGTDSPLLWIRVDPEMEYLAEIQLHQPVQMWINQLEKDKDVIVQSQAIAEMEKLPQLPFSVVNALNNFLNDTKAFWRVRVEAVYALALTASEDTDLAGLLHLVKFYKSRRFDADIGLPRPNDFRDVPEYFVLEAIPHAIALIRAADKKSPREAIEFVLQLLKYNDNSGNPYSDVYWLAAMVQAIGELEFGQQTVLFLSSLLKRIDRLLQFDSLMPSYNGILTISCIRTLSQIALKMSAFIPLDRACELIQPFRSIKKTWKVRIEASRVLLDLEFHCKGLDAAISLFLKFLDEEPSLRGETKLAGHVCHLCQISLESRNENQITCTTLVRLLQLLGSRRAFNNVFLRHQLFCILQVLAGRSPTLYGVPKVLIPPTVSPETCSNQQAEAGFLKLKISRPQDAPIDMPNICDTLPVTEAAKEADNISNSSERRANILKIRVKQTGSSSKADDADHQMDLSRGGPKENELGPCSSVSVDAPIGGANELLNISTQNNEEVNSSHDRESRMTASIGSAKLGGKLEICKELQCTADSKLDGVSEGQLSPITVEADEVVHKTIPLQSVSMVSHDGDRARLSIGDQEAKEKRKKDKKEKDKKRKREDKLDKKDDPQYLERKRLKKEKKRMEKEQAKMRKEVERALPSELQNLMKSVESHGALTPGELNTLQGAEPHVSTRETTADATQTSSAPKIRIKIKSRSLGNI